MSELTISEAYFEQLCRDKGVGFERVPESGDKSADYRVMISSMTLITEVKQLDPRPEDKRLSAVWGTPKSPGGFDATKRIRARLADGYPQVRRLSEGRFPTIIVIYSNAGEWNLLSHFAITAAMFGDYGFVYGLKPDHSIRVTRQGRLGNRKVTKDTYRSLGGVGVLKLAGSQALELSCYHNPFADIPIDRDLLEILASSQYVMQNPHDGKYAPWNPKPIRPT